MKYLARFLAPEFSTDIGGRPHTEPTKPLPRRPDAVPTPPNSAPHGGHAPYGTNETPRPIPAERWGPSLDHDDPSSDVPADSWRWQAANLPHASWVAWRARSRASQAALGPDLTAADIADADHRAYFQET